jgi:hypothetical protein
MRACLRLRSEKADRVPWTDYSIANGTLRWQTALREYVGWVAYSAMGRMGIRPFSAA